MYYQGNGVPQDKKKALIFYQKGCDAGQSNCCFNVGVFNEKLGNQHLSIEAYKKGCDGGHKDSCVALKELKSLSQKKTFIGTIKDLYADAMNPNDVSLQLKEYEGITFKLTLRDAVKFGLSEESETSSPLFSNYKLGKVKEKVKLTCIEEDGSCQIVSFEKLGQKIKKEKTKTKE